MQPNYDASVAFLQKWLPGGPWILTAISLDKKRIATATFRDPDLVIKFLEEYGVERNIYFSVNPAMYDVVKKPTRAEVKSLDWLHVDIDPRAGEELDAERHRALQLLQNSPNGLPKPTVIVFSGGGYQGFWKLAEPKDINGQAEAYEEAALYNVALELAFGADECHNVDRIMRLPGTINRPDERKRRKGRKEMLAEVVEWDQSRVYQLSQFTPAAKVQTEQTGFGDSGKVAISSDIKRVDDVNDLPSKVSDLCKVTIVQGHDPDDPNRFGSRSEALFFVCCELVRADCDNDTIYSIITDPGFAISASVLDKGRSASGYAIRQIERARENAINPHLQQLNDKYAVVPIGGKVRVIYEDFDEILERFRLVKMTFEDFRNLHLNQRVPMGTDAQGNPRYMHLGKWWLEHEDRREFTKIVFAPGREVAGAYNMWRGFAVAPTPGNQHEPFLTHIAENICGKDESLYQYVIGWMARTVQMPYEPGFSAIVLRGDMGVGKSFMGRHFGKLFGRHFIAVTNAKHITGNFNAHLRDCAVLLGDEAFYAGDKSHASTLKGLVTDETLMVEPKGVDTETCPNCIHLILTSNEEWVVPAGYNERRFCVLDVGRDHIQDNAYFGRIADSLRTGGYAHLLSFLMTYDLTGYDVRQLPQTQALQEQKVHSYEPMHDWWFQKLMNGKLLMEHAGWQSDVLVEALVFDFVEHNRQFGYSRRASATKLGQFLRNACPGGDLKRWQSREAAFFRETTIQRPYYYTLPSLDALREHWDQKFGGPFNWPKADIRNLREAENSPF